MLDLFVRLMKKLLFLPFLLLLLAVQDAAPVAITSPVPGEILRGQVNIIGSTNVPDFVSAQLDFSYAAEDSADTWFPLQTLSQSMFDSPLYVWDTTTITDGDYILRLRVSIADGSVQEVTVPITLQNDPLPTPTLAPTLQVSTPESVTVLIPTAFLLAASPTPTDIPRPTPTALPANPVSLDQNKIYLSLGRGALVILGLFALAGLIIRVRRF
jgi:hypothetical protein